MAGQNPSDLQNLMSTAVQTPLPHRSGGQHGPPDAQGITLRGGGDHSGSWSTAIRDHSFLSCLTSSPSSWCFLGPSPPRKDLQSHPVLESIGGNPKQATQPLPQTCGRERARGMCSPAPPWPGQQGAVIGVGLGRETAKTDEREGGSGGRRGLSRQRTASGRPKPDPVCASRDRRGEARALSEPHSAMQTLTWRNRVGAPKRQAFEITGIRGELE